MNYHSAMLLECFHLFFCLFNCSIIKTLHTSVDELHLTGHDGSYRPVSVFTTVWVKGTRKASTTEVVCIWRNRTREPPQKQACSRAAFCSFFHFLQDLSIFLNFSPLPYAFFYSYLHLANVVSITIIFWRFFADVQPRSLIIIPYLLYRTVYYGADGGQ